MKAGRTLALLQEAVAHHQAGRLAAAGRLYDAILKTDRANPDALNLKAVIAQAHNNHGAAIELLDRAIAARPAFAEAHYNRALSLTSLSRAAEAIATYKRALTERPGYTDAYVNLALLLRAAGRRAEALAVFRKMIEACPTDPRAHYGLATELATAGDFAGATAAMKRALSLKPDWPQAWNDLGTYRVALEDSAGALEAFDRAAALDAAYPTPKINRGVVLLAQGKLAGGWDGYRQRLSDPENPFSRNLSSALPWPAWRREPLTGKRILLWNDHGVGDALLYANMIPDAIARAAACTIACDPRLVPIFRRSFPSAEVVALDPRTTDIPRDLAERHFDFHSSALDLGAAFRPSFASFPNRRSVLRADPELTAAYRRKFQNQHAGMLVGLSWHSANPIVGDDKSVEIGDLLPLLRTDACSFVNLQYGPASRQLADAVTGGGSAAVIEPDVDCFADLNGLADVIAALDLVVTVSNTTAHLAGALGVPTWLLASTGQARLWYWFDDGDFSPWYPAVRLLRKSSHRNWSGVIQSAGDLLAQASER